MEFLGSEVPKELRSKVFAMLFQVLRDELLRQRTMPMSMQDAENFEGTVKDQRLRGEVQRYFFHHFQNLFQEFSLLFSYVGRVFKSSAYARSVDRYGNCFSSEP